jgi:hypothetical protein
MTVGGFLLAIWINFAESQTLQNAYYGGDFELTEDSTVIRNCVWDWVSATDWGCSVFIRNEKTSVEIYDTTFAHSATNWKKSDDLGFGGACALKCRTVIIGRCCGYYCTAYYWGQFAYIDGSGPTCTISSSTFLLCGVLHTDTSRAGDNGGIEFADSFSPDLSDLNFTSCRVHNWGSAILCRSGSQGFSCVRTTVYGCSGESEIDVTRSSLPRISFCNFYSNSASTYCVLSASTYGMIVSDCIFNGNGDSKDIGLYINIAVKFQVGNCVFSGPLPSTSIAAFVSVNPSYSTTRSHPLFAVIAGYCPAILLQTMTRSRPTATRSPLASCIGGVAQLNCVCVHLFGLREPLINFTGTNCLAISDSFFANIVSANHSAITDPSLNPLYVIRSSFYVCVTTSPDCWGGAISKANDTLFASFCCFKECQSFSHGMAISIGDGGSEMNDTNFVLCGCLEVEDSHGTLLQEMPMPATYRSLNFSLDELSSGSGTGSAFEDGLTWDSGSNGYSLWSMMYCTFFNCSGKSVIERGNRNGDVPPTVGYCNFIENRVGPTGAIVYAKLSGIAFSSCVFGGRSQSSVAIIGHARAGQTILDEDKFVLILCLYQREITNGDEIAYSVGCTISLFPMSLTFTNFRDCYWGSPTNSFTWHECARVSSYHARWLRYGLFIFSVNR